MSFFDALIVGAGFAGAVTARRLADAGKRVLVLENRDPIGGSAYDRRDEAGVLIHQYGPHIFHTNDRDVFEFLSGFTSWRDYSHKVVASIPGEQGYRLEFPVPFNICSLEIAFGAQSGQRLAHVLQEIYGPNGRISVMPLRESNKPELVQLANYIYETVFLGYTLKQWGGTPEQINPDTLARVPVVLSRDCRYFQDIYQGIPAGGYTRLFEALLDHPGIRLQLNADALTLLKLSSKGILLEDRNFDGPVIYSGAADELFGCVYGRLPYRTLDFQFETYAQDFFQSCGTINYTVDKEYTRITEFKYLTGQSLSGQTTIVREYPRAYCGEAGDTPYYPVICEKSKSLYRQYADLASHFSNLFLLGRLAEYRYYHMDAVVAGALSLARRLLTT